MFNIELWWIYSRSWPNKIVEYINLDCQIRVEDEVSWEPKATNSASSILLYFCPHPFQKPSKEVETFFGKDLAILLGFNEKETK